MARDYQLLLDALRQDLDDVDAAMRRLEDGLYGRCERCGVTIPPDRLATVPTARTCDGCGTSPY